MPVCLVQDQRLEVLPPSPALTQSACPPSPPGTAPCDFLFFVGRLICLLETVNTKQTSLHPLREPKSWASWSKWALQSVPRTGVTGSRAENQRPQMADDLRWWGMGRASSGVERSRNTVFLQKHSEFWSSPRKLRFAWCGVTWTFFWKQACLSAGELKNSEEGPFSAPAKPRESIAVLINCKEKSNALEPENPD